jgi:hypothetical protein
MVVLGDKGVARVSQALLDKDDCALEELMNEDDIIQECKAANSRLVSL